MASPEQKKLSGAVMEAVKALNTALNDAGAAGLFVELRQTDQIGVRNGNYYVNTIETRETVLP